MTPFRIFEFAIGGLLYFDRHEIRLGNRVMQALVTCTVMVIAGCVCFYSDEIIFPAWNAILPCVAAAVFIALGRRTTLGILFCSRPLLFIGRLSYSIYLTHWPIIVFYIHQTGVPFMQWFDVGIVLFLTMSAAFVLHYGVERRFRQSRSVAQRSPPVRFGLGASFATLALVTIAFFGFAISPSAGTGPARHSLDPVKIYRDGRNYTWDNHQRLSTAFNKALRIKYSS